MSSRHLTSALLNAWVDGELSPREQQQVDEHLSECSTCTSAALAQTRLKSAVAKAGQRYALPSHLLASIQRDIRVETSVPESLQRSFRSSSFTKRTAVLGWVTAALLLTASLTGFVLQRNARMVGSASAADSALVTEIFDHHVAALASAAPPQVLSSDSHTVKPWFQGRIPFSFNLPESLPEDTILNGANFTYIHGQPAAQLLYRIGKHRVSIFICARTGTVRSVRLADERSGFNIFRFYTPELQGVAVSDVNAIRLSSLTATVEQAQTPNGR